MSFQTFLASLTMVLALLPVMPHLAAAEVVGRLTQVEGRVDLLKGGKLPANPVKLQDGVEPGDVLRTKTLSKAQITFIDNSVITLSPESRLAVDEYLFDPGKQKRSAVLNLFQGLAHVVVNKLFKVSEPDFVIKTHTAITGVRGTDFGVRLHPNASTILNFEGVTQVGNIFPEVSQLYRRALKIAFSWGGSRWVTLKNMQGTTVGRGLPPTLPFTISPEDQKQFMNQMGSGLLTRKSSQGSGSGTGGGGGTGSGSSGGDSGSGSGGGSGSSGGAGGGGTEITTNLGGPDSGLGTPVAATTTSTPAVPLVAPTGLTTGTGNATLTVLNTVTVPPVNTQVTNTTTTTPATTPPVTPPPVTPPVETPTYAFTQATQSTWTSTSTTGTSTSMTSTGWGLRTGVSTAGALALPDSYSGYFTDTSTGSRTVVQGALFPTTAASPGVSTSTLTGTVTGVLGGTLTGDATMTGTSSFGQTISFTGKVSIDPSGVLTFTYGGANGTATITSQARLASATGTTTYTPGTLFTQTLSGAIAHTSTSPYSVQNTTTLWGGTTTTTGTEILAPYYATALTGGQTSGWDYNYLGRRYDTLAGTIQGVVNPTTLQGAASIIPADQDPGFVSSLPTPPSPYLFGAGANQTLPIVTTIGPASGGLTGTVHTTDYQDGKYASGVYTLTQTSAPVTPITGGYNFTETYTGAFMVNGTSSGSPGSANSFGYGYRNGTGSLASYFNGWFGSYDNKGTWTPGSDSGFPTSSYGSTLLTGSGTTPGSVMISGTVSSGTLGQPITGTMNYIGSLLNGASFNYTGKVTFDSSGNLKFEYGGSNGAATWAFGGATGTASGELNQYPGYHFTQTMPGTYQVNAASPYTGTLTLTSTGGGTRSGVYGGTTGPFSGLLNLYSSSGSLTPDSGSLSTSRMEGVVDASYLGANYGAASVTIGSSTSGLNMIVPGAVNLSNGGSYFVANGVYAQSNFGPVQVSSFTSPTSLPTALAQTPLYNFTETYNGFRISTGSTPYTLASVEGYGWGSIAGTGANPLPTSYTGGAATGYFVSQDLGTRASLSAMTPGWAGVTGSLTGALSGTAGQTLVGQMVFSGSNSLGTTYNYQGNATMGADGTLVWNYYGTWTKGSQTGTASGTWTQVLGTYFEQYLSGTATQTATTTTAGGTTLSVAAIKDVGSLTGTHTMSGATTNVTGSAAGSVASTVNTFPAGPNTGSGTLSVKGVVAGSTWQNRWGVATMSGTGSLGTSSISGTVTLDPKNKLTGQFVDVVPNGPGQAADNVTVNLVSVPVGSGQTTSSFVQTVSGPATQTAVGTPPSTQATLTTPTPLPGTSAGLMSGNINANVNLTTTAVSPTYVTAAPGLTGPMSATIVGAVGGPAGGPQTGVASMHSVKTIGGQTRTMQHLGTATHQPAVGTTPPALTVNLNGLNNSHSGVAASQSGTVTVTPK